MAAPGEPRSTTVRPIVLALLLPLAVLAACASDTLPPEVTIEEVVSRLAPPLPPDAAVDEPVPGAVHPADLHPGAKVPGSSTRRSLVVPPPARVRIRFDVPADAALHFSIGMDGAHHRDATKSGVEFRVLVDGTERFSETVNPAARHRDRRWIDGRVDLRREAGRTVEAVLETRATDPQRALAGTPGWNHVRLVRTTTRQRQRASADTPNVIVLLVDTLRADRLGVYGAEPSPSPTLDRLASRGLVFDDSVSQSSWTMPSVASILTGLHPRSHGAPGLTAGSDRAARSGFLADDLVTWPELAQQAGLTTVGISANPLIARDTNLAQGFETFVVMPWNAKAFGWSPATEVNRRFLAWLAPQRGWRFVAYLHYMEPHDPYAPPESRRPAPPPDLDERLQGGHFAQLANAINFRGAAPLPPTNVEYLRGLYDGEVRTWDEALGELLAGLASAGVLDSTIVIVTADHGEEFQEHGRLKHGSHLYEESIRVPLVIAGPGVPAGRRPDTAQGIDVFPTIAGLLGLVPPPLSGRDLLRTRSARGVVSETPSGIAPDGRLTDLIALRTARSKLIITAATGDVEFFDLERDAEERVSQPGHSDAAALRQELDRWASVAPPAPHADGADPTLRAKLQALGYVE